MTTAAVLLVAALAALVAAGVAMVAEARGETTLRRIAVLRRCSVGTGLALGVAAASAGLLAADHLGSVADLLGTGYGRVVLAEAVLLTGAAGLWVVNHRRNLPLAERTLTPVRRVSWSQAVLGGAAAGTAALLAVVTPPVGSAWAGHADGDLMLTGSDAARTATAQLGIAPGVPGPNTFTVRVVGFGNHRPIGASGLRLRFEALDHPLADAAGSGSGSSELAIPAGPAGPSSELALVPAGPRGVYRAQGSNLAGDGRWRITVVASVGRSRFEIPLETVPRCGVRALPGRSAGLAARTDLPGIGSLQASLTPGLPGPNEIRAAVLDPAGRPLALDSAPTFRISTTGHEPLALSDVGHPGPGQAVATTGLTPGPWRVDIAAMAGGRPVHVCFEALLPARPGG
ncbi:MAG TPA: hypothetical protein VGF00_12255 [Acidimicrobiia bacterium]